MQMQALGYIYGFVGQGANAGKAFYEIAVAYPKLNEYYGLLSGLAFSLSFSVCGIFAGIAVDKYNRVRLLSIMAILWSVTSVVTGSVNSLLVLALMRFFLGATLSAAEPAMYSIVADYFPTKMISTANSILFAGSYVGAAASSLCIMLTSKFGWRGAFNIMGYGGILAGLAMLIVREPIRGIFKKYEAE